MRTRTLRASTAAGLSLLALAGCGGGDDKAASPTGPELAAPLAAQLAARSDAVADRLAAGDACAAAHEADALHAEAIAAVNAGDVPPAAQEELLARTNELVDAVNCPEPAATEPQTEEPPPGEGKPPKGKPGKDKPGKGKGRGKGKG
jgi:hypothetical protein